MLACPRSRHVPALLPVLTLVAMALAPLNLSSRAVDVMVAVTLAQPSLSSRTARGPRTFARLLVGTVTVGLAEVGGMAEGVLVSEVTIFSNLTP